jgi:1-acyl-sn-glycerol-3-phosphate acyltransferase
MDPETDVTVGTDPPARAGPAQNRLLYWFGKTLFQFLFRAVWRTAVIGAARIPAEGGTLFAANHASFVDPPLVGAHLSRPIFFMAKAELFRIPLFGALIRRVNAFPVKRKTGDVGALRAAQRVLASGGALVVFPEGKRQKRGVLGAAKPGVGLLALMSRCPVVPVYLHNTHRVWRLAPLAVVYGEPLRPAPGTDPRRLADDIMDRIRGLKEEYLGSH